MTIVHCPRCRDEVTVPAKAAPRALVRCPLCLEEYLLAEALAEMPPALLIVGGEMDDEPALVGAGADQAEAGGEYGLTGGGFGGGVFDSSAPAGAAVSPARTAVKGTRPKRKEKSAIGEIIKIVLGGVVGISIALVGLWWIGDRDPFKIGPMVPTQIQFIVPEKFRGKAAEAGTTAQNKPAKNGTSTVLNVPPPGSDGSFQPAPGTETAATNTTPGKAKSSNPAGELQMLPDPLATEPGVLDPVAPASIDVPSLDPLPVVPEIGPEVTAPKAKGKSGKGKAKSASGESSGIDFTNLLPEGNAPATPEVNPNPPQPTPDNPAAETPAKLATAVQAANDALASVEAGKDESKERRQELFTDLYLAAADAGRVISHLDPADADVADPGAQLKRLLAELVAQPGKVSAFSYLGRTNFPERKAGEGFAVAGKVIEYRVAGSVFETTLDAGSGVHILVVSPGNPQDFCQIGDQLLALGRIVEEPKENVRGYEGDAERVMLLGDQAVVPK